ncbi:hypothetical protein LCGC14_3107830, partial [marine sediment metagenome]
SDTGRGWTAQAESDTVIFTSWDASSRTGTYDLTDTTSAAGSFAQTVVGGVTYLVTIPIDDGTWLFSITGVTSVAANREWIGVEGVPFTITIPKGVTTLYFESDTVSVAYMVVLAE